MSNNSIMFKKTASILNIESAEYGGKLYNDILEEINKVGLEAMDDAQLKGTSADMIKRGRSGVSLDELLITAFALVKEAAKRVLKIKPFDVQVLAGIAMHQGKLVEMQTGEGKTLAAVFPAYLNALSGKGVHVLTFNDYLAKRDAAWMGPVYRFLGLSVSFVQEGMSIADRRAAYAADITYITAKEAGFDYLRSFLCYEKDELVQRSFNFAIIDEADSILIDEARIPLVIAGDMPDDGNDYNRLTEIVRSLTPGIDYDTDEYKRNVYLTDSGLDKVEDALGCKNLYDAENTRLLCELNSALHAEVLLKRNIDYIVRNGKIEMVDEFTGRIADKRHWPDGLQAAVEAKEGLVFKSRGRIMGSITLQYFLEQYPRICGMTATARSSSDEFREFYGLDVVVIPPNRPCIRIDYPDVVFSHKEAKFKAIIGEVIIVHASGRPILIGTCSVEESDMLSGMLKNASVECKVLNAKNDELEAGIIARAGELGAVTVSTNMAGRGTDIRLGGEREENKAKVAELGGLYVIGTNRHESLRIDNQLRGRAGRQGDPGSSRFFISLEDNLIERFGINNALPLQYRSLKQDAPLQNAVIKQRIGHIQRVVEGQNFEIRRTLRKYSYIVEEQRRIIHKRRQDILMEIEPLLLLSGMEPEKYTRLCLVAGENTLKWVEKHITLFHIDHCWADYLDYIAYIREGIHLVSICGQNPLDEFHKLAIEAFEDISKRIDNEIVKTFRSIEIAEDGINLDKMGLKGPSSTWTYLISDDYFINNLGLPLAGNRNIGFASVATAASWPLLLVSLVYNRFIKKGKTVK